MDLSKQSFAARNAIQSALNLAGSENLTGDEIRLKIRASSQPEELTPKLNGNYVPNGARGIALKLSGLDILSIDVDSVSLSWVAKQAFSPRCTCCGAPVDARRSKAMTSYEMGHCVIPRTSFHGQKTEDVPFLAYMGWTHESALIAGFNTAKGRRASFNNQIQCRSCNLDQGVSSVLTFLDENGGRNWTSRFTKAGSIKSRDEWIAESVLRSRLAKRIKEAVGAKWYAAR